MSRMKSLVRNFSKAGRVVLNPFVGTFAKAAESMVVQKHHMFVELEIDAACFDATMPSIVEVLARQVINRELGIGGSKRVQGPNRIYIEAAKKIPTKRRVLIRGFSPGKSALQIFPLHISRFLQNRFRGSTLFQGPRQFLASTWSVKRRSRIHTLEADTLHAVDCSDVGAVS